MLGKKGGHTVTVVSPNSNWNWIPSNIWVGVGQMAKPDVVFPLEPVYRRKGIEFRQAKAVAIWPAGGRRGRAGGRRHRLHRAGQRRDHRAAALRLPGQRHRSQAPVRGDRGPGPRRAHRVGVHRRPRDRGRPIAGRDHRAAARPARSRRWSSAWGTAPAPARARPSSTSSTSTTSSARPGCATGPDLIYLTNEARLGDFGVDGMTFEEQGFQTSSETWTASLFRERGVEAILGAAGVEDRGGARALRDPRRSPALRWPSTSPCCCRRSAASGWRRTTTQGDDISGQLFAPSGFMKVDADYTAKPYEEWRAQDWPETYQVPGYDNLFAVGIAFAPPHADLPAAHQRQRHGDRARAAAHRHAVGGDGQDRGDDDRGPDPPRRPRAGQPRLDGAHGGRLRRLGRDRPAHRLGGLDDDDAGRPGLHPLPDRSRPGRDHAARSVSAVTG